MAVTLRDVARAAGVSRSTASRALSGSTLISPATRVAVEASAKALGYRVNRAASALRSNRSHLVGLVMNNLINATFHTVAEVVQRRAVEAGFQVILCITDADPQRERDVVRMLADHGVDGAIMIGTGRNLAAVDELRARGCAVVDLIRSTPGASAPTVLADDVHGARAATEHLIGLGHRDIGFIGGPGEADSGRERFEGYASAMRAAGLEIPERLVRRGPLTSNFGVEATESLRAEGGEMTALYAANHEAVFGVLPTLVAHGVSMPAELSLICHEDMSWLELWRPGVTVIDNGATQLATIAMDLLLQQIRDPMSFEARTYRVGSRLVQRESCAPPHRA
jgi:LacI family transcriptional regulator